QEANNLTMIEQSSEVEAGAAVAVDEVAISMRQEQKQEMVSSPAGSAINCDASSSHCGNADAADPDHAMLLAAILLTDSVVGRSMPFKSDPKSLRSYQLYCHWAMTIIFYVFIVADLLVIVMERPQIPAMAEVPVWIPLLLECSCIGFFAFRIWWYFSITESVQFFRDIKNIVVVVCIALNVIDVFCFLIWFGVSGSADAPVRWFRILRPLYMINFPEGKQIRRAFRNTRKTLVKIATVFILVGFLMAVFALLAMKLFSARASRTLRYPNGAPYFESYLESIWDLYILITTANSPDVMMPSYDANNFYIIFFFVFVVVCNYIFMSIFLAVIYNNYKNYLKSEVRTSVHIKRRLIGRAFDCLKINSLPDLGDVVTKDAWFRLFKTIYPNKSSELAQLFLNVLNGGTNDYLTKAQFTRLPDLLNVGVTELKDRTLLLESCLPTVYNSAPSQLIKFIVRHRFFKYTFDLLIVVNAFLIAFSVNFTEWYFLGAFVLEILLKLYVMGPVAFFRRAWNIFDFVVIFSALMITFFEEVSNERRLEEGTLDIILVLRVVRLLRIFGRIQRFRVILTTIANIRSPLSVYAAIVWVLYYMYGVLGMELFSGRIRAEVYTAQSPKFCYNNALNNSEFYRMRYCSNNFNDPLKAWVTLFELTIVNQWHVITEGFVLVTNKFSRLYFMSFHLICVILVINIFIAFILEAFLLEYNLSASKFESDIEQKIKEMGFSAVSEAILDEEDAEEQFELGSQAASQIRFHIKKRARKSVETLLQQMFEKELFEEELFDVGESSNPPARSQRNPTFSEMFQ
uniref:TPC1 protein n=1 Tax=Macrostomum lignano TaxID=282301 RepID=A0A1I8G189_9PLAT